MADKDLEVELANLKHEYNSFMEATKLRDETFAKAIGKQEARAETAEAISEKVKDERDEIAYLYQEWHGRARDLEAELERVKAERDERDRILQSLTPGGSEYVNAPQRCAEFVQETRRRQYGLIVKETSARKAAKALLAEAEQVLEPFADIAEFDISESESDTDPFQQMGARTAVAGTLKIGHLRAALAFLTKTKEPSHGE